MNQNNLNNFDFFLFDLEITEKAYYTTKQNFRTAKYRIETESTLNYEHYLLNLTDSCKVLKKTYKKLASDYINLLNDYNSLNLIQREILSNLNEFCVDVETLLENSEKFLLKHTNEDDKKTTL